MHSLTVPCHQGFQRFFGVGGRVSEWPFNLSEHQADSIPRSSGANNPGSSVHIFTGPSGNVVQQAERVSSDLSC